MVIKQVIALFLEAEKETYNYNKSLVNSNVFFL